MNTFGVQSFHDITALKMSSFIVRWSRTITEDFEPTDNLKLVLSLVWVVRFVYARHTANALTLATYSSNALSHNFQERLKVAVLMACSNGNLLRSASGTFYAPKDFYIQSQRLDVVNGEINEPKWSRTYIRKNEAIWFIDSLQAYYALERDLLNVVDNNYQRNGYFCIVYTGLESKRLETVHRIFQRLFALYVTNVNVFLVGQQAPYVYTYFPYSGRLCHRAEPQLLFSFGSISRDLGAFRMPYNFFPSKVADMHGCKLHVTAVEVAPFVQVDRNASTGTVVRLHGIEGLLLSVIAEKMNFRLDVLATSDRGFVYKNGTATGASRLVMEGSSNMTIGIYMYDERRATYMLPTFSYMTTPLLIGVSRGQQLTPLERLVKPFGWKIWYILGAIVLLAALLITLLRLLHCEALSQLVLGRVPLTNLINTLLGGNLYGTLGRGSFPRYLLTSWLLLTLVLRTAYQGELYIMLQDSRALSGVRSLQEAVARNYTFYCTYTAARILHRTVAGARVELINAQRTSHELIGRLQAGEQQLAVPMLLQTMRLYNQRSRRTGHRINVLPEKFITVTATFYLRRHSFLLHQFDLLLQRINSAGLVTKFESFYVDRDLDKVRAKQERSQLSIYLLGGIFAVHVTLLIFSAVVFLLELLSVHCAPLSYFLHILNF